MSSIDYNELFERKHISDTGREGSIEGIIRAMGPKVDMEQFKASGAAAATARMMENYVLHPDEHDPASIAYWADLGMVKEFHGEDVPMDWDAYREKTGYAYDVEHAYPQNLWKKWASYVPKEALEEDNVKKYPLVIALHGGGNTIYTVDSWGIAREAAERKWIVIMPALEADCVIAEILEEAKKLYPIDEEKIYLFGFSYGSINTNILAHQHPDWFAAVAPCGGGMSDGTIPEFVKKSPPRDPNGYVEPHYEVETPSPLVTGTIKLPIITISGEHDRAKYPMCKAEDAENAIAGINVWARVNDAPELTLESALAVMDDADAADAEKRIGLALGRQNVRSITNEGTTFDVGDIPSRDGVVRMCVVCEENTGHWPTRGLSRIIFDFFSHFKRDKETKESIYTEEF